MISARRQGRAYNFFPSFPVLLSFHRHNPLRATGSSGSGSPELKLISTVLAYPFSVQTGASQSMASVFRLGNGLLCRSPFFIARPPAEFTSILEITRCKFLD